MPAVRRGTGKISFILQAEKDGLCLANDGQPVNDLK